MPDVDRIIERVTRTIPDPPRPRAKPAKSWRGLKVGDVIEHADGEFWIVEQVNSQGAQLIQAVIPFDGDQIPRAISGFTRRQRLEDPNWRNRFTKRRKPRAKTPKP